MSAPLGPALLACAPSFPSFLLHLWFITPAHPEAGGYLSTFSPNTEEAECAGLALSLSFGDRLEAGWWFQTQWSSLVPRPRLAQGLRVPGSLQPQGSGALLQTQCPRGPLCCCPSSWPASPLSLGGTLYLASPLCDV